MEIENLKLKELIETEISNMILKSYPIGSIYLSTTNANPSTFLGGTWESWGTGRTIVGVNSSDTDFAKSEQTGGAKSVTLTLAQIPSHSHTFTGTAHNHGLNSHTHTYSKSATTTGGHTLTAAESGLRSHTHLLLSNRNETHQAPSSSNYISRYAIAGDTDLPYSLICNTSTPDRGKSGAVTAANAASAHSHGITLTSTNSGQASGNTANATATGTIGNSGSGNAHSNLQPYITCYMWKRTA